MLWLRVEYHLPWASVHTNLVSPKVQVDIQSWASFTSKRTIWAIRRQLPTVCGCYTASFAQNEDSTCWRRNRNASISFASHGLRLWDFCFFNHVKSVLLALNLPRFTFFHLTSSNTKRQSVLSVRKKKRIIQMFRLINFKWFEIHQRPCFVLLGLFCAFSIQITVWHQQTAQESAVKTTKLASISTSRRS